MTYTILSAVFANAEHSAAVLQTQEAGAVLASHADTPDLWQQMFGAVTPAAYVAQVAIPQEVTMRQARLSLAADGKLAAVDAVIDSLPEPDRTAARIEWEYSGSVRRHQPFVLQLAPAIGLDSAGLDALFIDAAQR